MAGGRTIKCNNRCVCGQEFSSQYWLGQHRKQCTQLETAIVSDVKRVTQDMGRPPTMTEYSRAKSEVIPSVVYICTVVFASWNDVLRAAELQVCRNVSADGYMRQPKTKTQYYWQTETY